MSNTNHPIMDEALLDRLKEILLKDDRQELAEIKKILESRQHLSEKVSPIIEEHLSLLKENFSTEYEETINKLIEVKLENSQEQILDTIYPALGTMIKKYVTLQLETLKESIDGTVKNTLSFTAIRRKFKSVFTGVDESDLILSNVRSANMEEIFLIERNSGILLGTASIKKTIDQDVIAGMLTAIKSFVEDAFKRESLELEMIEYGGYKILIQTFYSYYIAAAVDGTLTTLEKQNILQSMHDFASKEIPNIPKPLSNENELISSKLKDYFIKGNTIASTKY